jgi:hypothetical protein
MTGPDVSGITEWIDRLRSIGDDMLSPHEFATLMLLRDSPDQIETNRAELDTLLERQLVALEQVERGTRRPRITKNGQSVLDACSRMR